MKVEFCSPLYHLHKRICDRAHWIGRLGVSGIAFNTQMFGGKSADGKFNNLPKSMRAYRREVFLQN